MTDRRPPSRTCPRRGCSSTVTAATAAELTAGSPLWRCESDHHGPRFVGFEADLR